MMPGLEGKVAFITGAARGQGRSHAVRLARDGADILAVDICADTPSIDYPNATRAELDETAQLVESEGRKVVALTADVRDLVGLQKVFDEGISSLGRCDIVLANAGIVRLGDGGDPAAVWGDIIGTNLTGAWNTISVALPTLACRRRGWLHRHHQLHGRAAGEPRARASGKSPTRRPRPASSAS